MVSATAIRPDCRVCLLMMNYSSKLQSCQSVDQIFVRATETGAPGASITVLAFVPTAIFKIATKKSRSFNRLRASYNSLASFNGVVRRCRYFRRQAAHVGLRCDMTASWWTRKSPATSCRELKFFPWAKIIIVTLLAVLRTKFNNKAHQLVGLGETLCCSSDHQKHFSPRFLPNILFIYLLKFTQFRQRIKTDGSERLLMHAGGLKDH